jgi:hypothetical protein
VLFLPLLTACFDLREDIHLRKDGSGTYSLLLDMSKSREMIAYMKQSSELDSSGNFSVSDSGFIQLAETISKLPGISEAKSVKDNDNFIYGVSFNFKNMSSLNNALFEIAAASEEPKVAADFYVREKKYFIKNNIFYLKKFAEPLISADKKDEEVAAGIEKIVMGSNYVFNFTYEGKIKNALFPAKVIDDKTLKLKTDLKKTYNNEENIGTKIRIK